MTDDVTVRVLHEIRDEMRGTREELHATRTELTGLIRQTNERIDRTNERLGHLEVAMLDMSEQQRFIVRWLRASTDRDRRFEDELAALRVRVDHIESRLPPER